MKKAVVVFTKVPKTGDTKTRLTEARGGLLTPEEANGLYEACLLDVIDACLSVEQGDIWICHNQKGDRFYLDSLLAKVMHPEKIAGVFADQGGSFDECMQYAADFILKSGREDRWADGLIIVGGDLPTFQPTILKEALAKLEILSMSEAGQKTATGKITAGGSLIGACLVEGACQEGGFSLVGFTCTTPFDFHGVFYNKEGISALDMLLSKAEEKDIPLGVVETTPDVDIPVDLASLIPVLRAFGIAKKYDASIMLPQRTMAFLQEMGLETVTLPPQREGK